jgi:hypothetical protein
VSVGTLKTQDIKGSQVGKIKAEVQQALEPASTRWTDMLNLFPKFARERIILTLQQANESLNVAFSRIKFSEGGPRNIEQELADFTSWESGRGFFHALRKSIGTGFEATLQQAGLDSTAALAGDQFSTGILHRGGKAEGNVFQFPENAEGAEKFIKSITEMISLTSGLAGISPRGVKPFLTGADTTFLERGLGSVFGGGSDPPTSLSKTLKR